MCLAGCSWSADAGQMSPRVNAWLETNTVPGCCLESAASKRSGVLVWCFLELCVCVCVHVHVYVQVYTKAGGQYPVSSSIASHLILAANPSFCWLVRPEVCLNNDLSIQSRYCSKLTTAPHPAFLGSLRWAHIQNSEDPALGNPRRLRIKAPF